MTHGTHTPSKITQQRDSLISDPTRGMPHEIIACVEQLDLVIHSDYPVPDIGPLLEQTVLAGGKRLRPTLCFLMGGIFELRMAELAPYARLAEFVHSASLAHDDVLDMADRRRDKPTINSLSTNSKAVLSGDFLVSRVFKELSELKAFELIEDLATVMEHLVYGEWLQEESRYNTQISNETLRLIAQFKTASLIAWCCLVPARICRARSKRTDESESSSSPLAPAPCDDVKLIQQCKDLGLSLGIGFQLIDDVIDFDPKGDKDFARDMKNGFVNTVTRALMDRHPELVPEIDKFLHGDGEPTATWKAAAVEEARNEVRSQAVKELKLAQQKLTHVMGRVLGERSGQNPYAQSLIELIDLMGIRSF